MSTSRRKESSFTLTLFLKINLWFRSIILPKKRKKGEKPIIENWQEITARIEAAMQIAIIECLPDRQGGAGLQITPLGLHNP
jgi:hypothetical protein